MSLNIESPLRKKTFHIHFTGCSNTTEINMSKCYVMSWSFHSAEVLHGRWLAPNFPFLAEENHLNCSPLQRTLKTPQHQHLSHHSQKSYQEAKSELEKQANMFNQLGKSISSKLHSVLKQLPDEALTAGSYLDASTFSVGGWLHLYNSYYSASAVMLHDSVKSHYSWIIQLFSISPSYKSCFFDKGSS